MLKVLLFVIGYRRDDARAVLGRAFIFVHGTRGGKIDDDVHRVLFKQLLHVRMNE
ncbi:hypothetical protein SDC9_183038 [bioreactor metagenome]|uniref:Uncharacterized protein n=1 Tax=bioreactor metagenome TaxID=1076179 RepID=A0A645H9Z6_9ZZZZ